MSFLDNLENNLKALESREERGADRRRPTEEERQRSRATQPHARELRESDWTKKFIDTVVAAAHVVRTKVYITWSGATLRLVARDRRLELAPDADGVGAVFYAGYEVTGRERVDLSKTSPEKLAKKFLSGISAPQPAAPVEFNEEP
jgi:hypothetical protein